TLKCIKEHYLFKSGCAEPRSPRMLSDEVWLIKPDGTGELPNVLECYYLFPKPPQGGNCVK
ncbi:MAG: hypothetical protein DRJ47_10715, partial [Thermoprotei archaeon]